MIPETDKNLPRLPFKKNTADPGSRDQKVIYLPVRELSYNQVIKNESTDRTPKVSDQLVVYAGKITRISGGRAR
jgi:hypothetical protein